MKAMCGQSAITSYHDRLLYASLAQEILDRTKDILTRIQAEDVYTADA